MAFKGTSPKNLMTNSLIISLLKLPKKMFIKENSPLIWFIILNRHSQVWIITGRLPPSWNCRKHYFSITECFSLFSQIEDIGHTTLEIGSCMTFLKAVKEGLFRKGFASATQFSEVRVSCSFTLLYAVDHSYHLIHFYRQTLTNSIHLETYNDIPDKTALPAHHSPCSVLGVYSLCLLKNKVKKHLCIY